MKTPIHLVIGQEAAAVGCCAALRADRSRLHEPPHARRLSRQGRRPEAHAVRDALPHQRLRRLARRLDAPHRQVASAWPAPRRSSAAPCPIATGAALAAKMKRDDRVVVVVHRRCDDRRRRDGREPQLRGAEEAAGRSSSARTISIRCSRRSRRGSRRATSARGPRRTGCRRSRSTASTSSPSTKRSRAAVARARAGGGPTFIEARGLSVPRARRRRRRQQDRLSRRGRAGSRGKPSIRFTLFGEYLTRSRHARRDGRSQTMETRDCRGNRRRVRARARQPESDRRGSLPACVRGLRAADALG